MQPTQVRPTTEEKLAQTLSVLKTVDPAVICNINHSTVTGQHEAELTLLGVTSAGIMHANRETVIYQVIHAALEIMCTENSYGTVDCFDAYDQVEAIADA